jgi:phosphoribosylanthranilate isomerase
MTWVKICGMTNLEDALVAVDAGADAVGFVFYEKSPRCVTVEMAREIVEKLPERVEKVGVFVNESPERVAGITKAAGLTAAQLHGDEYKDPEGYSTAGKLLFCLPVADILHETTEPIGQFIIPKFPKSSHIVLDSGIPEQRGGTGKTFAWAEARWLVSALMRLHPVVVAGGLTASNVRHAAEFLKPWGVDVVSGVEARPGKKDPDKVRAFVKAVRDSDLKVS